MILQGHTIDVMRTLPAASFHCCVTSPPYWGLRDYGIPPVKWEAVTFRPLPDLPEMTIPEWEGCLGLEPNIWMYVGHMVQVFREVWRVLRKDGTLWLNLGDSYASSIRGSGGTGKSTLGLASGGNGISAEGIIRSQQRQSMEKRHFDLKQTGLKPKDLIGSPWRVAFALQADGWYLRSDNIWHKPNPMPESTRDRPTKAHEYMFLLSKSRRYYYDAEAIEEPLAESSIERLSQDVENQSGSTRANGGVRADRPMKAVTVGGSKGAFGPEQSRHRNNGGGFGYATDADERGRGRIVGKGNAATFRGGGVYTAGQSFNNGEQVERDSHGNVPNEKGSRNKRSVWTVATSAMPEAHFATFPPKLIEPCILAGCPVGGNVLEPFGGAGTTEMVSIENARECTSIELSTDYIEIHKRRTAAIQPKMQFS